MLVGVRAHHRSDENKLEKHDHQRASFAVLVANNNCAIESFVLAIETLRSSIENSHECNSLSLSFDVSHWTNYNAWCFVSSRTKNVKGVVIDLPHMAMAASGGSINVPSKNTLLSLFFAQNGSNCNNLKKTHLALDCFQRMNFAYQDRQPPAKLAAKASTAISNAINAPSGSSQTSWISDTGATDHFTPEITHLLHCHEYRVASVNVVSTPFMVLSFRILLLAAPFIFQPLVLRLSFGTIAWVILINLCSIMF
uniref:Uncharacterized protein n=1 Tax=Fagus sylvatica TaxID=28930 RepID=A0A2N9HVS7_FAGSY